MKNYIFKDFLKYTSLNVLGMIGLSCYILADTFFIANGVGEIGLSALNLALPMYCLINGLGLMIGIGGGTRYSLLKVNSNRTSQNIIFSNAYSSHYFCCFGTKCVDIISKSFRG